MSDQNPELAVQPGAVDTHCHLFLLDRQPPDVVEAARAAGVGRLIAIGVLASGHGVLRGLDAPVTLTEDDLESVPAEAALAPGEAAA